MVLVADAVLASAYSLWSILFQTIMAASVRLGRCPHHASAYDYFGRICSCFPVFVLAQFALGIRYIISSCPCFWQSLFRVSGCCLCVRKLDSSGDDFSSWVQCLVQQRIHVLRQYSGGFWKNVHIFYVVADSFPEALPLHSV